ncbi:MAG: hypothetical protein OXG81_07630 [Acidobacteria bacterium]|nr:hypothetical protein [Acidobacteriota bacterium]
MCPLRAALVSARGRCATASVAEPGHHAGERSTLAGSDPGFRDEATHALHSLLTENRPRGTDH